MKLFRRYAAGLRLGTGKTSLPPRSRWWARRIVNMHMPQQHVSAVEQFEAGTAMVTGIFPRSVGGGGILLVKSWGRVEEQ